MITSFNTSSEDYEDKILLSHITDLAKKCELSGRVMYTSFLNPRQKAMTLAKCRGNFYIKSYGGYSDSERNMLSLCPYEDDEPYYPISAVKVTASDGKVYSHRDYLGAVLNLGIKREKLGDIVTLDGYAVIFCDSAVADFIIMNLSRISRTTAACEEISIYDISIKREYKENTQSVASMRLDCVLASAIGKGRGFCTELISKGLVMLNYNEAKSASVTVKTGDVISARGFGKMIIETDGLLTKKGRVKINIKQFV